MAGKGGPDPGKSQRVNRKPSQSQSTIPERFSQSKGSPVLTDRTKDSRRDVSPDDSEITLRDVMGAITGVKTEMHTLREELSSKVDSLKIELNLIRTDLGKTNDRVKSLDLKTSSLVTDVSDIQTEVRNLKMANGSLARRLDEFEGRARRQNVRITGVPEKAEEDSTELFVEDLVVKNLAPGGLSKFFSVERAHRIPGGPPKPGASPRPIIARLFNYRDRDAILQASRTAGPLRFQNSDVNFFPDFTQAVQKKRQSFTGVKRRLRDMGLRYSMLYPAKLRIERDHRTFFFDFPDEVGHWLDTLPQERHEPTDQTEETTGGAEAQE